MRLGLLGPFEVFLDDVPQRLPGRGERALLALLALSVGRAVAATTLVDQLWPSSALPEDPQNALQIRVSKLRRALATADGADLIVRHGTGYRLNIEAVDVDAHRFGSLIESARRTGDASAAVDRYEQALVLWRGEPLVDFAGDSWAVVDAARLGELRLAAIAERAERMLTLGCYEQVAADLEPVVMVVPTRERLAGQLMVALFNAGRQAEALEVFARTRRVLADELGLDPSRELRTVMEQILRQEPAIGRAAAVAAPNAVSTAASGPVGNLPLRTTSFVGRANEVSRVRDLLEQDRLVTLAGPGGAGKTALAIEVARAAAPTFPDGMWLVRLAAVTESAMLAHAVADAMGFGIEGGTAAHRPSDVLIGHLAGRRLLVVLDNCEHLIEPAAVLVEAILERCPDVRILATSREALAVPGEVQLPVSPLAVPASDTEVEQVAGYPAVRLFLDRAASILPDLLVDSEVLQAVGLICRRLDGIPLALELAAARLVTLSPAELAERVLDQFAVLTSGSRTAEARQRTLRNTVDWSHDLLTAPEQVLFRRLAVFRGGWTLGAAERVLAHGDLPSAVVLDLLERLVQQSLVVTDHAGPHTRYRMLETLRTYAADKLTDSGEAGELAGAHAGYFLQLAEQAETGLRGASQARWLASLREEHANVRAALAWLVRAEGRTDAALRLAGSLGLYWHMGRHLEGRETLRRVMALPGGSAPARARAMQAVSLVERPRACLVHPSEQCAAAAHDSLEIFEREGDRRRAAFSRLLLSVEGVGATPRFDAVAMLERADRDCAELGDDWGQAVAGFVRMEILAKHGHEDSAMAAAEDATARFRALGDGWGLSAVLYHLGWALSRFGRDAEAVPVLREAIEVAARAGVYNTVQWATADLGLALLALGRVEEASQCFARAGSVPDQVGDDAGKVLAIYGNAVVAQRAGERVAARALFERAYTGFDRLGVRLATGLALAGIAGCDEQAGDLAAARNAYEKLLTLGQSWAEAGLIVGGLEGLARSNLAHADPVGAAELLARAAWLRDAYDRPATAPERAAADRVAAQARTALGAQRYAEAANRGAAAAAGAAV
jgi:predicted ATPase/DNA-binding SARP family transcriptional activator